MNWENSKLFLHPDSHFTRNDLSRLTGIVNSLEFEWIPHVDTWGQTTLSNSANSVDSSEWYETVTCSWKDFKVRKVTKTCQNGDQDLCADKYDIVSRDQTSHQTFFSCGDGGVWVGREEWGGLWFVRITEKVGFRIPEAGFRIPEAGFRIPKVGIPDSKGKKMLDSGFWIPLHGATQATKGSLIQTIENNARHQTHKLSSLTKRVMKRNPESKMF